VTIILNALKVSIANRMMRKLSIRNVSIVDMTQGNLKKTVKRYEYADGILTIAGKTYLESEIDYLEIDGRILVEPQESEDKE